MFASIFVKANKATGDISLSLLDCIGVDFNRYTVYKALEGEKEEINGLGWSGFCFFAILAETVANNNR